MIIDYDQIPKLIDSNLEVKIRNERLNSSSVKVRSLTSSFIPEVSLYAKAEDSKLDKVANQPSAGVVANFNIFNGLKDLEQKKINGLTYDTEKLESKKSYNELVFIARKYYFDALKIKEHIKILSEHEIVNKNNRNQILKKVASGLSPRSEELIFKKIDLELKEQRVREDNALKITQNNLKRILTIDKNEKIEISGSIDVTKFDYIPSPKKIDLALIESSEALVISEKRISNLWRMPRVDLYAERSFTSHVNGEFLEKEDEEQVFGVKLTIPLFSEKNIDSIESQQKEIEEKVVLLKKKNRILENESNSEQLEINLQHLKSMISISQEKVQLSKEIMEKTFFEFKLGLKEALSLNEATADYLESRKDLLDHQLEYILSIEEAKAGDLN